MDTGNSIYDYENHLDVIFLDSSIYTLLNSKGVFSKEVDLNLNTVIGKDILKGYIVENVVVYKKGKKISVIKKIIISFSKQNIGNDKNYRALIGYNTYIENLKGVTLC